MSRLEFRVTASLRFDERQGPSRNIQYVQMRNPLHMFGNVPPREGSECSVNRRRAGGLCSCLAYVSAGGSKLWA